jgi:hypothetical protein
MKILKCIIVESKKNAVKNIVYGNYLLLIREKENMNSK